MWECSHVGGDRFAPNVVLLPDGFYYGNLDPESAVRTVRQHLAGAVEPRPAARHRQRFRRPYRPRSSRRTTASARSRPDAVTVEPVDQVGPHDGHGSETTVELRIAGRGRVRVEVDADPPPAAQLTCRAIRETPATEYQVRTRAARRLVRSSAGSSGRVTA